MKKRLLISLIFLSVVGAMIFIPHLTAEAQRRRRGTTPRPATTPAAPATQRASRANTFDHDKNHVTFTKQRDPRTGEEKIVSDCDSCHHIPTNFYTKDNPLEYNVQEFPGHDDCLKCHEHRADFFKGDNPPICTVCHKTASPREINPKPFPKQISLKNSEFYGRFPHGIHQDILALQTTDDANGNTVVAAHATKNAKSQTAQQQDAQRYDCSKCHGLYKPEVEKALLQNVVWPGAVSEVTGLPTNMYLALEKKDDKGAATIVNVREGVTPLPDKTVLAGLAPVGTFRVVPDGLLGHRTCFECHGAPTWKQSQQPFSNNCVGCHGLGKSFPNEVLNLRPTATNAMLKTIVALQLKPGTRDVPPLPPRVSYKFQHDIKNHQLECTVCHINITNEQTLNLKSRDVPISSCFICHISKSAGGGISLLDEMNDRAKCLNLLKRDPVKDKTIENCQESPAAYTCMGCHTADTGKNPPPDSHFAILGRSRF